MRPRSRGVEIPLILPVRPEIPDETIRVIIDEWLVTTLVEEFLRERGINSGYISNGQILPNRHQHQNTAI